MRPNFRNVFHHIPTNLERVGSFRKFLLLRTLGILSILESGHRVITKVKFSKFFYFALNEPNFLGEGVGKNGITIKVIEYKAYPLNRVPEKRTKWDLQLVQFLPFTHSLPFTPTVVVCVRGVDGDEWMWLLLH